jgi:hypothetical protein
MIKKIYTLYKLLELINRFIFIDLEKIRII